ncbi:MAG: PH domain-containing protein [Pseudomonadales bacterium]
MQFELTPPPAGVFATLVAFAVLFIGLATVFAWFAWSTLRMPVSIAEGSLNLSLPFYGRSLPLASLNLEDARIVTIDASSPLRPRVRTNGIGLPGYSVGWFKLKDGSKALLALTSRRDVLYVPTTDGFVVLLSPKDPQRVLSELQAAQSRGLSG